MNNKPIGIFDSGVGGTSIWTSIHEILPNESTLYLADSANAPYGQKTKEEIVRLSIKNTEFLINQGCKMIVVACNTATTNAIEYLRKHYNVPFIGIEPAIKPAAIHTKTKTIGILATKGTLSSELFHNKSEIYAEDITIIEQVGSGLVELIENGKLESQELRNMLIKYCEPMLKQNIDYLVLGCTHYPYLIPILKEILPKHITILDSGDAVAKQTRLVLEKHQLINVSDTMTEAMFLTNGNPLVLNQLLGESKNVKHQDF